jgi:iron complex outermembrane receptor protein
MLGRIQWLLTLGSICLSGMTPAQVISPAKADTVHVLDEVIVKGYTYDRPISEVPASIGYLDTKALERFSNTSLLPAVNTIPGVRMEERSPGSYRFAIRGSSLRSPFGVRNVKMYWNGLPLTDGGGNTYLNLLDFSSIGNAEIIKGPGASLYGAGSGGVLLLNSPLIKEPQVQLTASGGSYGLQRYQISAQTGSEKVKARIQYGHQQANGYRDQTNMRRDALNTDLRFITSAKSNVSTSIFYTDLYYQTPGALTKSEYDTNPRQARPTTPAGPGAVVQQAAVYNKTLYVSSMFENEWNSHWSMRTGLYGSSTQFTNPTLRNYETRNETNWGARTETQFKVDHENWKGKLTIGGEFQYFKSPVTDYGNFQGKPDTVQVADKLGSTQAILFAQTEIDLPRDFYLTLGGSINFGQYRFVRTSDVPATHQTRNFDPVLSPRVALLKKISSFVSIYTSISQGFSTPTLAEVRPSTNTYNNTLNPEHGISYEAGLRGSLLHQKISFDITAYDFQLYQTIVIQHTVDGADYYINSGRTSQPGVEAFVAWNPRTKLSSRVPSFRLWSSYTYNPYTFKNYVYAGADYSGRRLTGVARNIFIAGADIATKWNVYMNVTCNNTSAIPLNDANTAYASSFFLLGTRIGYKAKSVKLMPLEFFGGVDNALNAKYSLGNDLNAAGGRYYNASSLRNFYLGLKGTF